MSTNYIVVFTNSWLGTSKHFEENINTGQRKLQCVSATQETNNSHREDNEFELKPRVKKPLDKI